MLLYLIRHADAVPLGEQGIDRDEDRPLSEAGEKQALAVGAGLARRGITFDRLLASPLLRAQQTARDMVKAWPTTESAASALQVILCDELVPGAKPKQLARVLRELGGEHVGLVGHMPHLGRFAAWLVGGKGARIDLAKAGVACIECDGPPRKGRGSLVWLVTPEWL